ncbi:alpha/beta fold hydrolase [Ilumatobacter coccineus]|uniref:Putative hydrolase n=1 Tax=Ilumatobacter coccineus (strain NBRC 103263 / KCTC 29153 / YM16-304) TaxID=1313172 RepID=A0A6C7E6B6_ILUCY|nr:alpha/beta fold hydrolase [Ilumatobacter coccineus]BAN02327.1 putative hydrolase [Ilumatobacter coccineus YM16-304]
MTKVMLVHGWAGSFEATWQRNGFTALLEDGGKDVIGVDMLGHGTAPKPHDPDAYADLTERLVEALPPGDETVAAIGFSLGAMTLIRTAIAHPHRFERLVLAGVGRNIFDRDHSGAQQISEGLDALIAGADPATLDQSARLFAQYAQQPGNDLEALAAVMRRPAGTEISRDTLTAITCPVLVVIGADDFAAPGDELAAAFPDGRCVTLPKTDHFATTESFGFFDAALEFVGAA